MSTSRLFFAFWPDDTSRAALAAAVAPAVREVTANRLSSAARPVPTANYHFTLAFLGSVPQTEIERLCSVAAHLPSESPVCVTVDTLEHWRKPQVLVATSTTTPPEAAALAERLTQALIAADFSPDSKPFRPHLTLARKVTASFPRTPIPSQQLAFENFVLVESKTDPAGPTYTVVRSFALGRNT